MRVTDTSLFFISLISIVAFVTPLLYYVFMQRTMHLSLKVIIIGIVSWVLCSQIVEKGLLTPLLAFTDAEQFPIIYAVITAILTGIIQEAGRYIAFTKVLKSFHKFADGIAFGIGFGAVSSMVIGFGMSYQLLTYARLLNTGSFISLEDQLPYIAYSNLINTLTGSHLLFILMGAERIFMFIIQVALSLIILLGIRKKQWWLFLLAVIMHIIVSIPEQLFQQHQMPVVLVEGYLAFLALLAFGFLRFAALLFQE